MDAAVSDKQFVHQRLTKSAGVRPDGRVEFPADGASIIRSLRRAMLDPQKTLECEALLRRYRELEAEIAQHERKLREGEARLPIEEQLTLTLRRLIEANIPELPDKVWVEIRLPR